MSVRSCGDGRRLAGSAVTGKGNFAMTAAAIAVCAEVLVKRKPAGDLLTGVLGVEEVSDLSEVKAGFEEHGIRIAPLP
jgi:hypothetical protein